MIRLICESYCLLIHIDLLMRFRDLQAVHDFVHQQTVVASSRSATSSIDAICHAMDLASVFYFKQVHCLQHSAAVTVQSRRYGWNVEMVTGVQMLPFYSHAWAELDGRVVNDKPYMHEMYIEMKRC